MVQVYVSRHTPGLEPGDGEKISFYVGETTDVISGIDKGRQFVVLSDRKSHAQAHGFVREGYFTDDPCQTRWAKAEKDLWPVDLSYHS